ncbi:MAG: DUF411 domain-containing protein [Cyanobacteria bacterium J06592_8]
MFNNQSSNWKKLVIAGVAIASIAGIGYWTVDRVGQNQTANQPTPSAAQVSSTQLSPEALNITVYRTPTCGCCKGWVEHIQQNNFNVTDIVKPEAEIQAIREQHNLPQQLTSCHTAEINGYLVEGHVPVEDVKQLITQKPNLAGIAVPGMPIGTPGMEMGARKESFDVVGFKPDSQTKVFNSYQ